MQGDLTFDKLVDYIKDSAKFKEDGSGIVIACQLMRKALKGLRLIPKKSMDEDERLTIKLIQNRVLEKFANTFRDTTKQSYYIALVT